MFDKPTNRPFPVKITICSLYVLWYHRKKGIVFYEKGDLYEKYCRRSGRHFEPTDTDTDLGICLSPRLHRRTFRLILSRGISVSAYSADCGNHCVYAHRAWHHLSEGTGSLFSLEQQRNERTVRAHADKRNLRKDI